MREIFDYYEPPMKLAGNIYYTKFGGYCNELNKREVGLNKEALLNTQLPLSGKVHIRKIEEKFIPSYIAQEKGFIRKIRPLNMKENPNASYMSKGGRLVSAPPENAEREFEEGEDVIINFTSAQYDLKRIFTNIFKNSIKENIRSK